MTLANDLGVKALEVYNDLLLIVSQLKGVFAAKYSKISSYLEVMKDKSKMFNPLI